MKLVAVVVASLVLAGSASAQRSITPWLGTGLQSPVDDAGLHVQGSLAIGQSKRIYPRADVLMENGPQRNLLITGNIVLRPSAGLSGVYALVGAGTFLDNGPHGLVLGGVGVDMPRVWHTPLALEARVVSHPDAHGLITLLVRP
jgi:hypothetical protein